MPSTVNRAFHPPEASCLRRAPKSLRPRRLGSTGSIRTSSPSSDRAMFHVKHLLLPPGMFHVKHLPKGRSSRKVPTSREILRERRTFEERYERTAVVHDFSVHSQTDQSEALVRPAVRRAGGRFADGQHPADGEQSAAHSAVGAGGAKERAVTRGNFSRAARDRAQDPRPDLPAPKPGRGSRVWLSPCATRRLF